MSCALKEIWRHVQKDIRKIEIKLVFHFKNHQHEADVSNLVEAPQDALTKAGVIIDDKIIQVVSATKVFDGTEGTDIELYAVGWYVFAGNVYRLGDNGFIYLLDITRVMIFKSGDKVNYYMRISASRWKNVQATFSAYSKSNNGRAWILLSGARKCVSLESIQIVKEEVTSW